MYIRDIIMDGFKCYIEKTTLKNIDKSFTAITGMNGAGKSNIIDAIIFSLDLSTSKYMRVTSLKELINIHRKECTVTIIFDNSNKSTSPSGFEGYETIEISRTMDQEGRSKFKMNNHNCTKSTIENLCKSMGVTNDFIVMQGHITKILNMKSNELKNMIEETSGTRNYSLEREKSLSLLEKKEYKLKEAQEHLKKTISPFFEQLKKEKNIYEENKDFEKNRKLYIAEMDKLDLILRQDDFIIKKNELETVVNDYANNINDLHEVENKLKEIENFDEVDLFEVKALIESEKNRIEEIKCILAEENSYNDQELKNLSKLLKEKKYNKKDLLERENILSKELLDDSTDKIAELESVRKDLKKKELELEFINRKLDMNKIDNSEIYRSENDIIKNTEKLQNLEQECIIMKNKIIYPTLQGSYVDSNNVEYNYNDSKYGTVDENFEFKDMKYKEAIITILGSRSKFVICKDDIVASELLKKSDRRISCIPLNKIVFSNNEIGNLGSGIPAIKTIKYEKNVEKAFMHIFNGFYIFEDKKEANMFCFKNKVMCVTLDGTVYDYKGTLTGGRIFYKFDITRMKDVKRIEQEIKELKLQIPNKENFMKIKEYNKFLLQKTSLEEELSILNSKMQLLERLCSAQSRINISELKTELEETRRAIVEAAKEEKLHSEALMKYNRLIESVKEQKNNYEQNKKNLLESLKKLAELQECLRHLEIKDNNRRVSLRMVEGLDYKKATLIKTTVRLKSRILKLYEEIYRDSSDLFKNFMGENMTNISLNVVNSLENEQLYVDFGFDLNIFRFSKLPLKKDERSNIEERINDLKEKISTKRTLNTMDPSNFELLEKNEMDIQFLEEKILKLEKDKFEIIKSIEDLTDMSVKENKKAFEHINSTLRKFLGYFLQNSDIYITEGYEIKVKIGNWKNSLSELSGGQRSLIALCLIFSMLTFKPAPFYIFDEIDAALDLNYTQSIGEIIKKEFHGAQFIVVSLKNNMFDNANRIFKVFIQDHKSKVCQVK